MDEMTLIYMSMYHIGVNHFKYKIIWQNMQENGHVPKDGYSDPNRNI
jgi:hypothetical protein